MNSYMILASTLLEMLNFVDAARADSREPREYLQGVLLSVDGHTITAIASDNHTLAQCKRSISIAGDTSPQFERVIEAPQLAVLKSLLKAMPGAAVELNELTVDLIKVDGKSYLTGQNNCRYPDLSRHLAALHVDDTRYHSDVPPAKLVKLAKPFGKRDVTLEHVVFAFTESLVPTLIQAIRLTHKASGDFYTTTCLKYPTNGTKD